MSRAPDELHYTYLDTFGRPVIVAYKRNLVEQHIQDVVVSGSTALPSVPSSSGRGVLGAPSLGRRGLSTVPPVGRWGGPGDCHLRRPPCGARVSERPCGRSGRVALALAQVHYTFNKVLMLQEPLLVVAAFYILFFTVIIYVRLDFSITKVPWGLPPAFVSPLAPCRGDVFR